MTLAIALARLACLVALAAIAGTLIIARRGDSEPRRGLLVVLALVALAIAVAQILFQAVLAAGDDLTLSLLWIFLGGTWGGKMALLRLGLIGLLAITLVAARAPRQQGAALALAGLAMLSGPLSGHAGTASPLGLSLALHGLHVAAAGCWLGGVLVLAAIAKGGRVGPRFREALKAFSPLALLFVTVAIAAGIGAAILQIESPAALIGTLYGQLLLGKVLLLLLPALLAAAWLRWRYLAREGGEAAAWRAITVEAAFGLGAMALGSLLAQTIPGRHDEIGWPLPFRFAPMTAWRLEGGAQDILATIVGAAVALLLAVILHFKGGAFRQAAAICAGAGAACLATLAYIVSVPAYPTTFAVTPVAYSADAIMDGRKLFLTQCVVCHGETGHGNGPGAGVLPIAPADLTARHTEDHTAGDMFWWISNGMPSGAMPGVGDAISEEEKWELITYIRALSSGYTGRYVPKRVIPRLAWLGAIDFTYQTPNGELASLSDWRERAVVLLILIRDESAIPRVRELLAMAPDLEKARTQIIIVSSEKLGAALGTLPGNASLIETDTQNILDAWSLYRRTFWDMDPKDERPAPPYMEFLIDRFGYVRLRGRGDDETLSPAHVLAVQAAYLAEEPQLRAAPDAHVH